MEVDEKVSSMIQKGEDLNKLLESQKHNFIKLFDDGLSKVENGDISYEDFITFGGESKSKDAGKLRLEGKDYIVQDGDVMHFRFNV